TSSPGSAFPAGRCPSPRRSATGRSRCPSIPPSPRTSRISSSPPSRGRSPTQVDRHHPTWPSPPGPEDLPSLRALPRPRSVARDASATIAGPPSATGAKGGLVSQSRVLPRDAGRAVRPAFAHGFSGFLPFMDASFDAVICLGLFEHIPPWLQATTLREMLRVARRGGAIYLMLLNNRSLLLQAGRDNR